MAKSSQLQIRVTPEQKASLKHLAEMAGQDVSSYVLSRALPEARTRFEALVSVLVAAEDHRFPLAELNDLLTNSTGSELSDMWATTPGGLRELSPFLANYLAAMVEQAAHERGVTPPAWVREIPVLAEPYFATALPGLRLHLLRAAPVPFKRRNLYVDAAVGARV
jgi:uncharacterized protein (DUF1778 family)